MSNVNTVAVSGNLTRDPEYKKINDDFAVAKLGIAVNRRVKDASSDDGYGEKVSFFDVEVLGSGFAALVGRKMKKGDSATVTGRLEQQTWETTEGDKRSKVVIIATEIDSEAFFRSRDEDNSLDAPAETAPAAAPAAAATPAEAQVAAAVAADDDIPF
jgi:single-strand DNA-binding protein